MSCNVEKTLLHLWHFCTGYSNVVYEMGDMKEIFPYLGGIEDYGKEGKAIEWEGFSSLGFDPFMKKCFRKQDSIEGSLEFWHYIGDPAEAAVQASPY